MPDIYLFSQLLLYNFAGKSRRLPGPLQRVLGRFLALDIYLDYVHNYALRTDCLLRVLWPVYNYTAAVVLHQCVG